MPDRKPPAIYQFPHRGLPPVNRVDGGGGGGDDEGMEDVLKRMGTLETDVAVIKSSMATRADLHEATTKLTQWMVGVAVGLGVAAITVGTFVLNNATPKAPTAQMPPIIINVPNATHAPPQPAAPKPP